MKKLSLITLMLFIAISISAQDTISIFECYKQAIETYETLKNSQLLDKSNQLKQKSISSLFLPQININAQVTYQSDATSLNIDNGTSNDPMITGILTNLSNSLPKSDDLLDQYKVYADISQLIYDGGVVKANKNYEQIKTEAQKQNLKIDELKVKENVNTLYFNILLLQEQEKALLSMKLELKARIKNMKSGVANGILLKSDLQLIQAEFISLEQKIIDIHQSEQSLIQNLISFIEYNKSTSINLIIPDIQIPDTVLFQRPELEYLNYQVKSLEATKEVLKSSKNPKVIGFGQVGYGKPALNMLLPDFDTYYIVGAKLSWNIWDWNKNKTERQIVSIGQQQIENQKESLTKNINLSVNQFKNDIEKLNMQIIKDAEIIKLRNEIAATYASKLENGTITPTDYISILNAETQAKINLQSHRILLSKAKINYLTSLGIN